MVAEPVAGDGLTADLAAAHVALAEWPLDHRIVTPATVRHAALAAVARIADFVAMRPGARGATAVLAMCAAVLRCRGAMDP